MPHAGSQSVGGPHHHNIKFAAMGRRHHLVECRTLRLCATNPVGVFVNDFKSALFCHRRRSSAWVCGCWPQVETVVYKTALFISTTFLGQKPWKSKVHDRTILRLDQCQPGDCRCQCGAIGVRGDRSHRPCRPFPRIAPCPLATSRITPWGLPFLSFIIVTTYLLFE
jgi:hypothetical protein